MMLRSEQIKLALLQKEPYKKADPLACQGAGKTGQGGAGENRPF